MKFATPGFLGSLLSMNLIQGMKLNKTECITHIGTENPELSTWHCPKTSKGLVCKSKNPELSTWHYSKNSKDLVCIISCAYGSWKHIWFEFCIIGKALCPLLFALFWRVLELDGCQYSCRYYYLLSWLKCNQSLDPPTSLNHNRGYSLH